MYCVFSLRENKSHSTCKRSRARDCSDYLLFFFVSLYFLDALKSDNNSNTVYALGHKYAAADSVHNASHLRVTLPSSHYEVDSLIRSQPKAS